MLYNVVDASAVQQIQYIIYTCKGFLGDSVVKKICLLNRRVGFHPWLGRSSGERNGNPLQYSCLGNPMDKGVSQATSMRSQKSQMQLSDQTAMTHTHTHTYIFFLGFTSYLGHQRALRRVPCAIQ